MIKTKQVVTVPLSGSALAWMPSKGNAKPEDFVFKLPSYISVNCQIKQWAKTAGLEKKTTHGSPYICHHITYHGSRPIYNKQVVGTPKHQNNTGICRNRKQEKDRNDSFVRQNLGTGLGTSSSESQSSQSILHI